VVRKYLARAIPYLTGRLLDIGCGHKPYQEMIRCREYIGMEMTDKFKPDIVGDVRNMHMFESNTFDSILSNQVLEHIDNVGQALREMQRVLKPGGYCVLTAPFIARLHGLPHDYWRFSISGLRYLLEKSGFKVEVIEAMGGYFTTLYYLRQFFVYEKCQKYIWSRWLCKVWMSVHNPWAWFVHKYDYDQTTPFNYLAIARKIE